MKIIKVDNFDRDTVPDILIATDIQPYYGELIIGFLNNIDKFNNEYFKLVKDDYILKERNLP